MNKEQKVEGLSVSPAIAKPMLVVVRVLNRLFRVMVEATTIEVAENLINEACKTVDFQIINVVKVK